MSRPYTFEDYMIDRHAEQYSGLDDGMGDDFNDWLCRQDIEDVLRYADKWHDEELVKMKAGGV